MRFLGIDYGTKRIGLALSDEEANFSFPHDVWANDKNFFQKITDFVKEKSVGAVVIGESLNFKQQNNPIMEDISALKERIEKEMKLPVHLEPEFFTSAEARRLQGKHEKTDASAAAIILQSYLDKKKGA